MWTLQGLDYDDFVSRYWQRQPCLIRNAFANIESPVSPAELAGLACEADVHCRLVIEQDGASPWQLRYGPFTEADFLELPETHYSLLVSECEKWFPELTELLDQFRFIPDWRVDDLMLSYAPEHGSVGPHSDEYDVFLLQTLGSRRWQYCQARAQSAPLLPDLELAILSEFTPDHDTVLHPGDMLYLPPGCAHHGIALEPCMTYSIGFRAPDAVTTLESFALEIEDLATPLPRYRDLELELDRHHAEITDVEIERFKALAVSLLDQPAPLWRDAVGKMLSDSSVTPEQPADQPIYISDLLCCGWIRHPESRMIYHRAANTLQVYYNGLRHEIPRTAEILLLLQQLCESREWSVALIKRCIVHEPLENLLVEMATNGAIIPLTE